MNELIIKLLRSEAETRRIQSETRRSEAETLKIQSETRRSEAETLKTQSETRRSEAETLKTQSETLTTLADLIETEGLHRVTIKGSDLADMLNSEVEVAADDSIEATERESPDNSDSLFPTNKAPKRKKGCRKEYVLQENTHFVQLSDIKARAPKYNPRLQWDRWSSDDFITFIKHEGVSIYPRKDIPDDMTGIKLTERNGGLKFIARRSFQELKKRYHF